MLRRIWRVAIKAIQRLEMAAAWLVSLFQQRQTYVVERLPGRDDGVLTGKVCVFAHFDRKGEIHDYVLYYLKDLRRAGFKIVFVSNASRPIRHGVAEVSGLADRVLRRKNIGGYFGAYKDGIAAIEDLSKVDLLLLANDSLYGPLSSLGDVFRRISGLRGQFWSLTDSWERAYHLDTDFILFGREAIASPAFKSFWAKLRYINSKNYVFRQYEVGLSQSLIKGGLRGSALCSYRDASRAVIDAVRAGALQEEAKDDERQYHLRIVYKLIQKGQPFNISAYLWDYLITAMGYPFIKSDLFQRSTVKAPYISYWQRIVSQESGYDPDLIVRHLEATLKSRFT
jgi:lipopolysaccharide biosynthesis protein